MQVHLSQQLLWHNADCQKNNSDSCFPCMFKKAKIDVSLTHTVELNGRFLEDLKSNMKLMFIKLFALILMLKHVVVL